MMTTAAPISGQPVDHDGPVFREPWEASAFAMAVKLSEAGYFTWSEWAEFLSQEIRLAEANDHDHHRDDGSDYYHHWFAALEKMLAVKAIVRSGDVDARHTFLRDNPAPHAHVARREPVCVA